MPREMIDWKKAVIGTNATLQEALLKLDQTAFQILLLVNNNGNLIGTISDGDIRRGLLRNLSLDCHVTEVVKHDPIVVRPDVNKDKVVQLMLAHKIHQIPVVDHRNILVGLHLWGDSNYPKTRPNSMVIMAGGLGTRLRPFTNSTPKPMLAVAGKPILEHIIERAHKEGFTNFILAVNYLKEVIENYFGDGSRHGVHIDYVREDTELGTAGALSLIVPKPDEPFVVTNGDVITDVKYGDIVDFHARQGVAATMAVRLYEIQHPYGVVNLNGLEILGFEEKPVMRSHINAGIYVLAPSALDYLNVNIHCDMPTLFSRLQLSGKKIIAYPMHEPWLDIGREIDLEQANRESYNN